MGNKPHPDPPNAGHPFIKMQKTKLVHLQYPPNQAHAASGVQKKTSGVQARRQREMF
jgi:hypothetical protein